MHDGESSGGLARTFKNLCFRLLIKLPTDPAGSPPQVHSRPSPRAGRSPSSIYPRAPSGAFESERPVMRCAIASLQIKNQESKLLNRKSKQARIHESIPENTLTSQPQLPSRLPSRKIGKMDLRVMIFDLETASTRWPSSPPLATTTSAGRNHGTRRLANRLPNPQTSHP